MAGYAVQIRSPIIRHHRRGKMVITTREQRKAIAQIFNRAKLFEQDDTGGYYEVRYRQFRKKAQPTFGCDGAVALPWCGMWLVVERDGYVHS